MQGVYAFLRSLNTLPHTNRRGVSEHCARLAQNCHHFLTSGAFTSRALTGKQLPSSPTPEQVEKARRAMQELHLYGDASTYGRARD